MRISATMRRTLRGLDLQAKVIVVLLAVIIPTFVIVTIAENQLVRPLLEDEVRQSGINTAKTLATEITTERLLQSANPSLAIENNMKELLYFHPGILRMDVFAKDPKTGLIQNLASSVEDDPGSAVPYMMRFPEMIESTYYNEEGAPRAFEILFPIEVKSRDLKAPKKIVGAIRILVSLQFVGRISDTVWKTTGVAAVVSVALLVIFLSYFLRKTIENDRLLKRAESVNLQLSEQLSETQRQLMNSEKLAVMGQLTASFAHEIGTPLNAISGHLQLLTEEIKDHSRIEIIQGQVSKIESIVKNFLQNTAKPRSQNQLVDLNQVIDKTIEAIQPRASSLQIEIKRHLDREISPIRAVPIELEQVLLNLTNNSLDSLQAKIESDSSTKRVLDFKTETQTIKTHPYVVFSLYDTGEGISKENLAKVTRPFFTTKKPGQGTGLGLTICQELVKKLGGSLDIDSKEGYWTKVTIQLPYSSGK